MVFFPFSREAKSFKKLKHLIKMPVPDSVCVSVCANADGPLGEWNVVTDVPRVAEV